MTAPVLTATVAVGVVFGLLVAVVWSLIVGAVRARGQR